MLDGFKDDCPTCLAKEEAIKHPPTPKDKEFEILFPKENDKRERDEKPGFDWLPGDQQNCRSGITFSTSGGQNRMARISHQVKSRCQLIDSLLTTDSRILTTSGSNWVPAFSSSSMRALLDDMALR